MGMQTLPLDNKIRSEQPILVLEGAYVKLNISIVTTL